MVRYAFTMIELIFAIVIISISVMSLPMMTQITSKAIEANLVQEAIFASAAEINIATTYVWDDDSLRDDPTGFSRVVKTSNDAHDCNATSQKRLGHIHRQCLNDSTTINFHTTANLTYSDDAINFSAHTLESIYIDHADNNVTVSTSGYKKEYNSKLDVTLCSAGCRQLGLEANNQNLREVTITITDENNVTVTLLRTYSANIGELAYESVPLP